MEDDSLRKKLMRYKVAIQPNRHTAIWKTLCQTFASDFNSDVRNLFIVNHYNVAKIKEYILSNKKKFPYLSGTKILNYWLYVIEQYTGMSFEDRDNITVAPDTHVLQASVKMGLIREEDMQNPKIRDITSALWKEVLRDSGWCPIDIHTPLWLWSRSGFEARVGDIGGEFSEGGVQLHL